MFACGVVLFNMVSGKMPFKTSKVTDEKWKLIQRGDWDAFWKSKSSRFSERLKNTI
jgi:hypothetical protein